MTSQLSAGARASLPTEPTGSSLQALADRASGRPDEKYGEEVVAFVQLVPGSAATAEQLVAFSRQHLSAVKYPREVRIVDVIPLTSVLKTDRKRLRAQLAAETSQA